jgi:hypothetical protein
MNLSGKQRHQRHSSVRNAVKVDGRGERDGLAYSLLRYCFPGLSVGMGVSAPDGYE